MVVCRTLGWVLWRVSNTCVVVMARPVSRGGIGPGVSSPRGFVGVLEVAGDE